MITGRLQKEASDKNQTQWDYSACLYPQGNLSPEGTLLFNHKKRCK